MARASRVFSGGWLVGDGVDTQGGRQGDDGRAPSLVTLRDGSRRDDLGGQTDETDDGLPGPGDAHATTWAFREG